MNIALISKKFINNDISYNLSVILNTMDELTQQVDFICFGEAFLQGFDCLSWNYSTDKNIGISCSSSIINNICKKAIDCKIAVAFGYIESDAERLFSSYMVISKFGKIIYNYRRISTGWKESIADYHYQEGADCLPFEIDGITFSIGLCGDLWDDSIINSIAILNTNITLWPVYLDYSESKWNGSINNGKDYRFIICHNSYNEPHAWQLKNVFSSREEAEAKKRQEIHNES